MKKTILIPVCWLLIFPVMIFAQEKEKDTVNTIYCAEFDVIIADFDAVDPSVIRVCCGGPFANGETPCKVLSKAKYECFSGQSGEDFDSINDGIFVPDLIDLKKKKLSKITEIEVVESSVTQLGNNLKIAVRKGKYDVNEEGRVFLDVEYLK